MTGHRTSSVTQMWSAQRAAILERLIRSGPATGPALARELGLSQSAVRRIIDELRAVRIIRDPAAKESGGARKGALIEISGDEPLSLCLDLGGTKFYGAVTDLAGRIRFERTLKHHGSQGEASYRLVLDMLGGLLGDAQSTGKPIMGIGVGVPGVTRHRDGVVVATAGLEWENFPLGQRLQDYFHLPVIVDNDVNLAALGEAWFGAGKQGNSLVWINVGTGIGGGIILDGQLYRGAHEMAGEIGYIIPGREFLRADYPGFGALELEAAGVGIARRAAESLRLAEANPEGEVTAKMVAEAYRQGEGWAIPIIEETVDYLAIALGALISVLDPELVVLGGGVMQSLDTFVEPLARRLDGKIPHVPPIVVSALGSRSAVLGAMISLLLGASDFDGARQLP